MAKYYTDAASTPVFAVTFVSNRDGIVSTVETSNDPNIQKRADDINNEIKALDQEVAQKEKEKRETPTFSDRSYKILEKIDREIKDLRAKVDVLKDELKRISRNIKDEEYLIYSNLEIKNVGGSDLSQQSNWYLTDAEVELTRDWPICKAKLVVTCKINDDGTIPSIVNVEKGFTYDRDTDGKLLLTNSSKARLLSADDEVRIYAGYKSEPCITVNDLDKYPYSFTTIERKEIPSIYKFQLAYLEKQKEAVNNAINTLKNPFTDVTTIPIAITALAALGLVLTPIAGGGAVVSAATVPNTSTALATVSSTAATSGTSGVTSSTALSTTVLSNSTAATTTSGSTALSTTVVSSASTSGSVTTALSTNVLPRVATQIGTKAASAGALPTTAANLDLLATAAYNKAIAAGLGITAATIAAINVAVDGARAEDYSNIFPDKVTTNYLEGRQSYKDNKELFNQLNLELQSIDKLIKAVQLKAGIKTKPYTADPNKLAPIFWGFIDTVDFIGSSNSIQIIYNLRDRSRILADTKLITIPYLNENKGERGAFEGLRHKTLEGVYRAANGGIYLDNNYKSASGLKWREGFDVGEVITLYDNKIDSSGRRINDQTDKITEIYKDALAEQRIKFSAAIEDPARWVIANSFLQASDIKGNTSYKNYDPLFHIWTLQPPLVSGSGATTMQIINKSPFEILGYMQVTEVMPIDYYCSHVNGHFIFGPRILDTSGLDDLDRGNRTYFFFDCFDKLPQSRSLIKNIRVQTSTIGVYNRFTIAAADFNNATNASLSDLLSIVDITPVNTRNRKIPIKQHIITDPKIAKEANKEGAAQALALTAASNMARDNTTIIMKVLGDASFNPGEAIRVFNTVLHSKDTFTFNGQTATSSSFLKTLYEQVEKIKAAPKAQVDKDKKIANLSQVLETIRNNSGIFTDDLNNVLPMYKVRAITHTLKATGADAGFITKIVAVADIL